jgi:hypothetical protein
MLALEYALTCPRAAGVQSLVLSSTLCSTRFWIEEAPGCATPCRLTS